MIQEIKTKVICTIGKSINLFKRNSVNLLLIGPKTQSKEMLQQLVIK